MPDYKKIRDMVSHRVTIEYDTGARIVGTIASVAPPQGPVQFALLSRAHVLDPSNKMIARYDELPVVPNNVVLRDVKDQLVTIEYDTGAKIVGTLGAPAPQGAVKFDVLSKVEVIDANSKVIARYAELPVVPNNLVGVKVTEGPL
jgi:hypothetical protein